MTATNIATKENIAHPSMYLSSLTLKNFRSCVNTTIELQPTLTLLVGENNSGKSNVIDAFRLATTPLGGRRSRYFEAEDVSHGHERETIELTTKLDGLTDIQRGQYITALDLESHAVYYTTRFVAEESTLRRVRPAYYAGKVPAPDAEPEKREQITHVYLEPLRDAQRALDSAEGNRLARIIEELTSEEDRDDFVKQFNAGMRKLEDHPVLGETSSKIQDHLHELTSPVRQHNVGIKPSDFKLRRLVRALRVKMAEEDVDLADLAESGLGYANLLFIATVILELRNAQEAELTLFLVEEPEAHLHPQLQTVLLDYLKDQAEQSGRDDKNGPAGRIQVIATTHSPNLASSVGVENVVVMRTSVQELKARELGAEDSLTFSTTRAIPVARLGLQTDELRKINQYVDATRASLLFARRVILVEGIAEAVLLPALVKHCVFATSSSADREGRRSFRGVTVIAVGSVDFSPYVKLLLTAVDGCRILDHLVIITDGDPQLADADSEPTDEISETLVNRKAALSAVASAIGAADRLIVEEATYTLEADLAIHDGSNLDVLGSAYLKQHPRSEHHWQSIASSIQPAEAFYRKLRANKRFIGKGEFAHDVAAAIAAGDGFICPAYLVNAITAALTDGRIPDESS